MDNSDLRKMSALHFTGERFRPDIQGLRAFAVGCVLVFHIFPTLLPGGYVGVDIFFVISGYLITSQLLRNADSVGKVDLTDFYTRRALRLLPAAAFVLFVVALATLFFLPANYWERTALEIVASAFYFENWMLAAQAVDYLGAERAPSPVQHYWSLSIEEQFYLIWPILIGLSLFVAKALPFSFRGVLSIILWSVFFASLTASYYTTAVDPTSAYFVSHTRIWELAMGGLLTLRPFEFGNKARQIIAVAGMAAFLFAAFTFSTSTPFPGLYALLPTVGVAMIIASGRVGANTGLFQFLSLRPLQYLGDISYSIYLWHWPVIVFLRVETGKPLGPVAGIFCAFVAIALASWSKFAVEDRFRNQGERRRSDYVRIVVPILVAAPILPCLAILTIVNRTAIIELTDQYPGAKAVYAAAPVPDIEEFTPPLALARKDTAGPRECRSSRKESDPIACQIGDSNSDFRIFLVGDSHAAHWGPALSEVAKLKHWNVTTYLKNSCPFVDILILDADGRPDEACLSWVKNVDMLIEAERPDIIIVAHSSRHKPYVANENAVALDFPTALAMHWRGLAETGASVIAIADTPWWSTVDPAECINADPSCFVPYSDIARRDPIIQAQTLFPEMQLLNFNDIFCPDGRCQAVIGNVIVHTDRHHMTASFSRSMSGILDERLGVAITKAKVQ